MALPKIQLIWESATFVPRFWESNGGSKRAEYTEVFFRLILSAKRIPVLFETIFAAPVLAVFYKRLSFWTARNTSIT
jgi:hypothetical protein